MECRPKSYASSPLPGRPRCVNSLQPMMPLPKTSPADGNMGPRPPLTPKEALPMRPKCSNVAHRWLQRKPSRLGVNPPRSPVSEHLARANPEGVAQATAPNFSDGPEVGMQLKVAFYGRLHCGTVHAIEENTKTITVLWEEGTVTDDLVWGETAWTTSAVVAVDACDSVVFYRCT